MIHSLDSLNAKERELLRLLAQGHTTKTISQSLGVSAHAINERLRSARRKTGAPSSRELARQLVHLEGVEGQENCDKFPEVDVAVAAHDQEGRRGLAIGARSIPTHWKIAAMLAAIAAGVVAYVAISPLQTVVADRIGPWGPSRPASSTEDATPRPESPDFLSFTGAQYQTACASSDARDQEYCAALLINQMVRHGPTDGQLCLPDGGDGGPYASSNWAAVAKTSASEVGRIPVTTAMRPADVALAALKATYPCATTAQQEASLTNRTLPVWVSLERAGRPVEVAPGQKFVVEIVTGDGASVSRFSNGGSGGYTNDPVIGMGIEGRFLPPSGAGDRVFTVTGALYGVDGSIVSRAAPVTIRLVPGTLPSEVRPTLTFSI